MTKQDIIKRRLYECLGINNMHNIRNYLDELSSYDSWPEGPASANETPRPLHRTGTGSLENLGIGPGRITLIGGVPKIGKTTLVNQVALDALRADETLFAMIANVETSPSQVFKRLLARLSGLPIHTIEREDLEGEAKERLINARKVLWDVDDHPNNEGMYSRIACVCTPFDSINILRHFDIYMSHCEFEPCQAVLVIDFVQCFKTLDRAKQAEWLKSVRSFEKTGEAVPPPLTSDLGQIMDDLRALARLGMAVVVVSRLNRHAYDEAAMGGFHGGGELEYQCDNAFIMTEAPDHPGGVLLREVANRHAETRDRLLRFERQIHRFTPWEDDE